MASMTKTGETNGTAISPTPGPKDSGVHLELRCEPSPTPETDNTKKFDGSPLARKKRAPMTQATKNKIAAARTGKKRGPMSQATKDKIAAAATVKWASRTKEQIALISANIRTGHRPPGWVMPLVAVRSPTGPSFEHLPKYPHEPVAFPRTGPRHGKVTITIEPEYYDDLIGRVVRQMPFAALDDPWPDNIEQWLTFEFTDELVICHGYRVLRHPKSSADYLEGTSNVDGTVYRIYGQDLVVECSDGRSQTLWVARISQDGH